MDQGERQLSEKKLENVLIHLYRGEVQRVNTWRNRMDRTPYWSLVMAAGMISWSFTSPDRSPALILLALPLTIALLSLESHRYRMHELWRARLRLLEENFISSMLDPDVPLPRKEWMKVLSQDLRKPEHKVNFIAAVSVRLRRIYFWIFTTIIAGWFMKLFLHPTPASSFSTSIERAGFGFVSGNIVSGCVLTFFVLMTVWAIAGIYLVKEQRGGEVLEEEPGYEWRRNNENETDGT